MEQKVPTSEDLKVKYALMWVTSETESLSASSNLMAPAARPEAFTATTADLYALVLRMHIRFLDFSLSSCRKIEYMDVKEVFIQFRDEVNWQHREKSNL